MFHLDVGGTGDAEGPIRWRRARGATRWRDLGEDVAMLTRAAGVMVEVRTFPVVFASIGAFPDYARVRRVALATDPVFHRDRSGAH
jgi:hypothetical protein